MIDDRSTLRDDLDDRYMRLWTPQNNRFGWTSYLGHEPGDENVPAYAAPARRQDLAGLPETWIGVGTNDLFHDEDLDYARRLSEAGASCTVSVVPGAFHGFDVTFRETEVAKQFKHDQIQALRPALHPDTTRDGL